jgi:predicted DNA-binding transcriptional regulator AlpA
MRSTESTAPEPKKGDKGIATTAMGALKEGSISAVRKAGCFQTGAASTGPASDDSDLVTSIEMRRMLGGISAMTVWRWTHSETIQFPAPDATIAGRSFWRKGTIRRFVERHATKHGRSKIPQVGA